MIEKVTLEGSTFARPPARFEAGTPNIADAVALGAAIEYLEKVGMDRIRQHGICLTTYALERLSAIPGLRILGPLEAERRVALTAFTDRDIHPHDMATVLDRHGVAVRSGHHCAMPLSRALGIVASARASYGIYNTRSEVDLLAAGILHTRKVMTRAV